MSEFIQPAKCPLCDRETLVYKFGRMRCTSADCDFCEYCEGPCLSGTAEGCHGAKGVPGNLAEATAVPGHPTESMILLHKHLQKMRPIFAAAKNDPDARRGLEQCDAAMIAADMTWPDFDFYAENTEGQASPADHA